MRICANTSSFSLMTIFMVEGLRAAIIVKSLRKSLLTNWFRKVTIRCVANMTLPCTLAAKKTT